MRWKEREFSTELQRAVDAYDYAATKELCNDLVQHLRARTAKDPYPEESAKDDLQALRNKRYFDLLARVADALLRSGADAPQIHRQYAQALLDLGEVSAGLAVLQRLLEHERLSDRERTEAQGLIGRANKQIYMDAGAPNAPQNRRALKKAIDSYLEVYLADQTQLWHGVNAVSLLKRAERDGWPPAGDYPDADELAQAIAKEVRDRDRAGDANMWDLATGAEAWIAVGDFQQGGELLSRYVQMKRADAFELASTLRQFRDVVQLDRDEGNERYLLDLLRAELLRRSGGELREAAGDVLSRASNPEEAITSLEKVLGDTGYVRHKWLLTAFQRAQGVARIQDPWWEESVGTGFVLPGAALSERWKDHSVLLTNSHVVSRNPVMSETLLPKDARIRFDALNDEKADAPAYQIAELLWESPPNALDTTIVRLDTKGDKKVDTIEPFPVADVLPSMPAKDLAAEAVPRIYVIGHPQGKGLSYSIQDNRLLGYDAAETRMHYRSPTDPGSSGSPVFDDKWRLVAIHHAGKDKMPRLDDPRQRHPANEGIPLKAIIEAVNG